VIVGNGDIAKAISAHLNWPDWVWFASGVSNSQETGDAAYKREYDLLVEQPRDKHLVYFSSLSVLYSEGRYASHKRAMELSVKYIFSDYTIIRLGNITWGQNPHTLINHLRARHAAGLPLDVQPVYRYVVDLPEFQHWLALVPEWSCELNIPGRRLTVRQIVDEFVCPVLVS
jgi:hypothetical protein